MPLYATLSPAILSAAILPCLFAGPASGIAVFCLFIKSTTSIASPTAYISLIFVSICSLTNMCPLIPSLIPLSFKKPVSGVTPIANITKSAVSLALLLSVTSTLSSLSLKDFTPSFKIKFISLSTNSFSTITTISASNGARI